MTKDRILLRINILVCCVIVAGFILTAILSYKANFGAALVNVEQVSDLASEGIYYQLEATFAEPVNVSLAMANDSLLKKHLLDEKSSDEMGYVDTLKNYLGAYQEKYGYDSVFLVSTATRRYYNYKGIDRMLEPGNPENDWYYAMLQSEGEYSLNVDNDEAADNEITVFVNCKIKDDLGNIIGIVGVGAGIDTMQELFKSHEMEYGVSVFLIDRQGDIEISSDYTGYEKQNFFELYGLLKVQEQALDWQDPSRSQGFWARETLNEEHDNYIVVRSIPDLSWSLIVKRDTGMIVKMFIRQLFQTIAIIIAIIIIILLVINYVIKKYSAQILKLTEEKRETFRRETEQLYENIYELNVTKNCAAGASTKRYFESLGVPKNMPYDDALKVIAEKQIEEGFREGYISAFQTENVIRQFNKGNTHLQYDFRMTQDGKHYFWMRIDGRTYLDKEDNCIHLYTYRKNIDEEKRQEIQMIEMAQLDNMTQLYNKTSTQTIIEDILVKRKNGMYAFFILDIDNFKQANDLYGHAFGDSVILEFTDIIRQHFREDGIMGRIGGDEFVIFIPVPDKEWVIEKTGELLRGLNKICTDGTLEWNMSASIGIAIAPKDGSSFEALYKKADNALYQTKAGGKNGYTLS